MTRIWSDNVEIIGVCLLLLDLSSLVITIRPSPGPDNTEDARRGLTQCPQVLVLTWPGSPCPMSPDGAHNGQ